MLVHALVLVCIESCVVIDSWDLSGHKLLRKVESFECAMARAVVPISAHALRSSTTQVGLCVLVHAWSHMAQTADSTTLGRGMDKQLTFSLRVHWHF